VIKGTEREKKMKKEEKKRIREKGMESKME